MRNYISYSYRRQFRRFIFWQGFLTRAFRLRNLLLHCPSPCNSFHEIVSRLQQYEFVLIHRQSAGTVEWSSSIGGYVWPTAHGAQVHRAAWVVDLPAPDDEKKWRLLRQPVLRDRTHSSPGHMFRRTSSGNKLYGLRSSTSPGLPQGRITHSEGRT